MRYTYRSERVPPRHDELVLHPSGDWMTWDEYLKVTYTPPWYRRELDKLVRECFSRPEEAHVAS